MKTMVAVIGSNDANSNSDIEKIAFKLGKLLVDNGFRILNGGMGGIMKAASRGARSSRKYSEGDVVGILPTLDRKGMNEFIDIPISTGIGIARNQIIVASSDVIVALSGGAGTLNELAYAWQLGKPIIAFDTGEGWASKLSGIGLDKRRDDHIVRVTEEEMAIVSIQRFLYKEKSPLSVGEKIQGRYIVKELFTQHDNRYVYLLTDKNDKKFMLKIHDFISEEDQKRFINEMNTIESLSHPNIQQITSKGTYGKGKLPYFISPFYGRMLNEIDLSKVPKKSKAKIISQLENLIDYLKNQRYVHKDIKLENIMVDEKNWNVILIDYYSCDKHGSDLHMAHEKEAVYNLEKVKRYIISGKRHYKLDTSIELRVRSGLDGSRH